MEFKKIGIKIAKPEHSLLGKKETKENNPACPQKEDKQTPVNPSYWQSLFFSQKAKSSYKKFDKITGENSLYSAQNCVKQGILDDNSIEFILKLIKKRGISKEGYKNFFISAIKEDEEKENIKRLTPILVTAVENDDKKILNSFDNLCLDNGIFSKCDTNSVIEILDGENDTKLSLLQFFSDLVSVFPNLYVFKDANEFLESTDEINKDNLPSVEEFIKNTRNNGYPPDVTNSINSLSNFKNIKTGKLDKSYIDVFNFLFEQNKENARFPKEKLKRAISSFADEQTGVINRMPVDFLSAYCLKPKNNSLALPFNFEFSGISNAIKDNNGSFSEKNKNYLIKAMESEKKSLFFEDEKMQLFNAMKDKKGIIDEKKFSSVVKNIQNFPYSSQALMYINAINEKGVEKTEDLYSKLLTSFDNKQYSTITALAPCLERFYDEGGNFLEEEFKNFQDVAHCFKNVEFNTVFIDISKHKENRDLVKSFGEFNLNDANAFLKFVEQNRNKDFKLNDFAIKKAFFASGAGISFNRFLEIFNECMENKENIEDNFNEKLFNQAIQYYKDNDNKNDYKVEKFKALVNGSKKGIPENFKTKLQLYDWLSKKAAIENLENPDFEYVKNAISMLSFSLAKANKALPVKKEDKEAFINSVLKSNKNGKYTEFEEVMKNSIPVLKKYADGLPLKFSRKDFLKELKELCASDKNKIDEVSEKLGIKVLFDEDFEIEGYDGILSLDKLNKEDEFENSIYKLCHKYLYDNEIQTEDEKLNKELNKIIKAMPEFINTIGKIQHKTHSYSLDVHELLFLSNAINNPLYKELPPKDKLVLKFVSIIHDISKKENIPDKKHPEKSAIFAKSLAENIFNNSETADRVENLVAHHHWLKEYNDGFGDEDTIRKTAFDFRRPFDFKIAQIMARADLESISDSFYENLKGALDEDKLTPVKKALEYINSKGNVIFSDYPVLSQKSNEYSEEKDGKTYKVINLHRADEKEDMSKYGFEIGKKKNDLNMLVHMVDDINISSNLNTFKDFINSSEQGAVSASLISLEHNYTYADRKYGLLLSCENSNIINTSNTNQTSGKEKNTKQTIDFIFDYRPEMRNNCKKYILKYLKINSDIKDSEYAKFYEENLASKSSFSQIKDDEEYTLCDKKFTGKDLKNAIKYFQSRMLNKEIEMHNEAVVIKPKIKGVVAKEEELKNVSSELLDFAYENELPILLI